MTAPVRVVLDTNVALSALVFRGSAAGQLRLAWQNGLIMPLASIHTAQELIRVLAYPKFRLSALEQEEFPRHRRKCPIAATRWMCRSCIWQ
jgi:uncharacterized protein